eukprot:511254-Rhodomonas_salina.1
MAPKETSVLAQATAAGVASFLTGVTLYPLDVIKTRHAALIPLPFGFLAFWLSASLSVSFAICFVVIAPYASFVTCTLCRLNAGIDEDGVPYDGPMDVVKRQHAKKGFWKGFYSGIEVTLHSLPLSLPSPAARSL